MTHDPGSDSPLVAAPRSEPASPAGGAAPRLALRSPVEVFLWIFVTRLMALLTANRSRRVDPDPAGPDPSAAGPGDADTRRADRVASSRGAGGGPLSPTPPTSARRPAPDHRRTAPAPARTRAIAVTTATAAAAGAAAFAAGRRRGAR